MYLWIAGVAFAAAAIAAGARSNWPLGPLGVVATFTGLALLSNFHGGADAMAKLAKSQRPMGVDYSKSIWATTGYARFFGAFAIVIGAGMTVTALASL